jgi:hypothetical protein
MNNIFEEYVFSIIRAKNETKQEKKLLLLLASCWFVAWLIL